MNECRGCGESALTRVLDFGKVPAPDHFPLVTDLGHAAEARHGLAIELCHACGLAQLADDDTGIEESLGVEPQALRDQAEVASDADVVLDCFGIMDEPDQRSSFARRAEATRKGGVLLLQRQSIVTIAEQGQWNALRHGHFAY
ncbi:hypothetical protein [Candidatus Mycolicibacterium alkanivorans]|uniref:Methyltransferase putative zinc binding domain-containing protein n=1 Tax=Candidatus Mycolicibacterium alkanivorans TaxID=2954114 RepID=A0ABS9YTE4_9MYCO|nr:hypothetical protein [Candidatus Mycolicibacterium alkanivorans]MCI4674472.1 hypothetical protein [Candidatus Mycolicibacterium alkanivorans]